MDPMERFTKKHSNSSFFHQNSSDFPVKDPRLKRTVTAGAGSTISANGVISFGGLHMGFRYQNDKEV